MLSDNLIILSYIAPTVIVTQEHLDEMTRVSSSLISVLGSTPGLGMQQH
jgi:hypothetical protein